MTNKAQDSFLSTHLFPFPLICSDSTYWALCFFLIMPRAFPTSAIYICFLLPGMFCPRHPAPSLPSGLCSNITFQRVLPWTPYLKLHALSLHPISPLGVHHLPICRVSYLFTSLYSVFPPPACASWRQECMYIHGSVKGLAYSSPFAGVCHLNEWRSKSARSGTLLAHPLLCLQWLVQSLAHNNFSIIICWMNG